MLNSLLPSVNIFINKLVVTDKKRVIDTPLTVYTIYTKRTYLTKKERWFSQKRTILTFKEHDKIEKIK